MNRKLSWKKHSTLRFWCRMLSRKGLLIIDNFLITSCTKFQRRSMSHNIQKLWIISCHITFTHLNMYNCFYRKFYLLDRDKPGLAIGLWNGKIYRHAGPFLTLPWRNASLSEQLAILDREQEHEQQIWGKNNVSTASAKQFEMVP